MAKKAKETSPETPREVTPEPTREETAANPASNRKKKARKRESTANTDDEAPKEKRLSKKKLSREAKNVMEDVRYGRTISIDFFRTNAWLLVIFIGGMIGMMGLRYKNKTKMAEIKQLEIELTRAKSSKLKEKSEYMSLIRETEIRRLVEEKRLDLIFREEPPVVINESE